MTARPAAAPYTRILVGGTASALGVSATEAGLARVDCGNLIDSDVAYDFAAAQTPDYGGVVGIANYAAHEAGHAFGLEHVDDPGDVMYAAAQTQLTLPGLFGARLRRRRRLHAVRLADRHARLHLERSHRRAGHPRLRGRRRHRQRRPHGPDGERGRRPPAPSPRR